MFALMYFSSTGEFVFTFWFLSLKLDLFVLQIERQYDGKILMMMTMMMMMMMMMARYSGPWAVVGPRLRGGQKVWRVETHALISFPWYHRRHQDLALSVFCIIINLTSIFEFKHLSWLSSPFQFQHGFHDIIDAISIIKCSESTFRIKYHQFQ